MRFLLYIWRHASHILCSACRRLRSAALGLREDPSSRYFPCGKIFGALRAGHVLRNGTLLTAMISLTQCVWISFGKDDVGRDPAPVPRLAQLSVLVVTHGITRQEGAEFLVEKVAPGREIPEGLRDVLGKVGFRKVAFLRDYCDLAPTERTQLFGDQTVPLFALRPCRPLPDYDAVLIVPREMPMEVSGPSGGYLLIGDNPSSSGLGLDRFGALLLHICTLGLIPGRQEESQIVRSVLELRLKSGPIHISEGASGVRRRYTSSHLSYFLVLAAPFTDWRVRTTKTIFGRSTDIMTDTVDASEMARRGLYDAFQGLEEQLAQ